MIEKKLKIIIPDDLTPSEEAFEISKQLNQKLLINNSNQKRLGNGIKVKYLKTEIIIERKGKKPIEFIKCPMCTNEYQSDMFHPVYTNYGGIRKLHKLCSKICVESFIAICGDGRAAITKRKLKPLRTF